MRHDETSSDLDFLCRVPRFLNEATGGVSLVSYELVAKFSS